MLVELTLKEDRGPEQTPLTWLRVLCRSLPAAPFEFDFEEAQLTEQNVRDLVFEEMLYYHPDLAGPVAAMPPQVHQKHFVAA